MKYLNTNHLDLLASYGTSISVSGDYIKTVTSNTSSINVFSIIPPSTQNVYFSVNNKCQDSYSTSVTGAISIGIYFNDTNDYIGIQVGASGAKIKKIHGFFGKTRVFPS